ncbi:MAG: SigE family RNA polymerase sigma factor [Acidimicrobiia bacterium]
MLWLTVVAAGKTAWTSEDLARATFVETLYHQEAASLVRLARLFTDDRTGAEDIVQEAFIRLYYAIDRIEDIERSAAYLRSIVLNLARDQNRRGLLSLRHQDSMIDRRTPELPEDRLVRDESQIAVIDALNALSPRQRHCLVLRFYMDLTEKEIAATLAISPNSVKTHCQRGMAVLAGLLEPAE